MARSDDPLLQEARLSFRAFYSIASADDATWMDALLLAWIALTQGTNIPREIVPAADRDNLERACDKAERSFMEAREQVRACPTFQKLVPGDQQRIAAVLFEVYPALSP